MAEIKKYLDTTALGTLVDQIKSEDAKALASAKSYTDESIKLCDVAGAANTAEANAKAYTDELANGQVKANTDAIGKLNGDVNTEGSVAKAVSDAQTTLQANIDAVDEKADANAEAIEALETLVGELPDGTTATSVVDYVNVKTSGIATDAALGELNNQVSGLQSTVQTINNDYLKSSDKTELSDAISSEATTARAAEKANADAIKAIQDDYLVEADKTELQGNIDTVGGKVTTLIGSDANKSVRTIANEELAAQLVADGAKESLDTLAEIAAWIQSHPDDASAMNKAIEDLEALVGVIPVDENGSATYASIVAYIQAVQVAVDAEESRATGVESGLDSRIGALEEAVGESGSIAEDIAAAKQEAINTASEDATSKANTAESNAKAYTDTEVGKDRARLDALELIDHDHSNKAELDLIVSGDKAKWDDAYAKAHEHSNKAELDKIVDGDVAKWNAAEGNAKTYADGLNSTMQGVVDGIGSRVGTLETASATHALASDLDGAVERIAKNETDIATLTTAVNSFTAITSDEVNALFA